VMTGSPSACHGSLIMGKMPLVSPSPNEPMGTENPKIRLRAALRTDVGVVRDHNEDSAHVDGDSQFFIVADGMGGHAAGEVASAMAVETVRETLEGARPQIVGFAATPDDDGRKNIVALLESAVRAAHQAVYQRGSREADKQGMGTTLDVVLVAGPEAFVAHVGDSRTYLIRDGRAAQITTDHTVAEVLVIEGKLSVEEAQVSPLRTILVNAIGVAADVGVELAHLQLRRGDQLLLCSDGLHDYFPAEQELAERLTNGDSEQVLGELVELAKERGGHDNITGVVVEVMEVGQPSGVVESSLGDTLSNGVPAAIEKDDTLPVDLEEGAPVRVPKKGRKGEAKADKADARSAAAEGAPKAADAGAAAVSSDKTVDSSETAETPPAGTPPVKEKASKAGRTTEPLPTVAVKRLASEPPAADKPTPERNPFDDDDTVTDLPSNAAAGGKAKGKQKSPPSDDTDDDDDTIAD
jgi:serine/threonine protein phosphatase PrpC